MFLLNSPAEAYMLSEDGTEPVCLQVRGRATKQPPIHTNCPSASREVPLHYHFLSTKCCTASTPLYRNRIAAALSLFYTLRHMRFGY